MRIGRETNSANFEYEMQDAFEKWLKKKEIEKYTGYEITHKELKYLREVTIPEISRRADFLLILSTFDDHGKKNEYIQLINVEAKCNQLENAIRQSYSHSKYCDYCFLLISDIGLITKSNIKEIQERGIGLIMYNYYTKEITESLPAFYNKGRNSKLKKKYLNLILNKYEIKSTQIKLEI